MIRFLLRLMWPFALLQCIQASAVAPRPLIYGRDNAYYFGLPVYKLIKPGVPPSTTTTTTTTTTPAPSFGYPSDILDIAYKKLGLKKLPRIEDLGELIGTGDAMETIEYLRKRTGSDADIALMKQYMDTLHFEEEHEAEEEAEAEAEAEVEAEEKQEDDNDDDDDNTMDNSFDEDQPREIVSPTKAPEPQESMMQRFSTFLKQWTSRTPTPAPTVATPPPRAVSFQPVFVVRPPPMAVPNRRPVLVRQPVPYHYPVPFRPVTPSPPSPRVERPTEVPSTTAAPKPHLNTPKEQELTAKEQELTAKELEDITIDIPNNLSPHIMQFAKLANISPVIVDRFLQRQPKLAALAKKVSTLALSQEQTQEMESQVLMAVHKALSQSEEMSKILEAAQTLK